MLKKEINLDGKRIISIYFDGLEDLLSYIETTPPNTSYWDTLFSRENSLFRTNFTGTSSLEEAIELCRFSKQQSIDPLYNINDRIEFKLPNSLNKRKSCLQNYGFRPNIQKNIIGHPKQMYKIVRDESKKFINVNYNFMVAAGVSPQQMYNRGIILLNLINLLENLNYRVNLNFFEISYNPIDSCGVEEIVQIKINIKKFNQKLDTNICYFPMCHTSFVRRILFAVFETLEFKSSKWKQTYGVLGNDDMIESFLKPNKNDITICNPKELGIFGNDLIEDTINFFSRIEINKYLDDSNNIVFDEEEKKFVLTKKNKYQ